MPLYRSLPAAMLAALSFSLAPLPAFAQEQDENRSSLTVGVGPAYVPTYEGSDQYRAIPIVQARGKVEDFAFWTRGPSLYVDLVPNRDPDGLDIQAGPATYVRFDRNGGIKDPQVKALGNRNLAFEVGGFVGIGKTGLFTSPYDNLTARVSWMKDVGKGHGSYVVTPQVEYSTPLSPATFVGASVSGDYVGKGYGRYYYDITPEQSIASGLPAYAAAGNGSGFKKLNLNLSAGHSLSGDLRSGWTLFGVVGYSKLLGDYKRSPIVADVGDSNQWVGAIGIGYTF